MNQLKTAVILGILLIPYTLMNVNAQEEVRVEIAEGSQKVDNGKFYMPTRIAVTVGTTVTWTNFDDAPHTVTSGTPTCVGMCWGLDFDSEIMRLDDVYTFTFNEPGTYPYLCVLHPWMVGTVTVLAPGQEVPVELSIKPDRATYKVGDNVVIEGSVSKLIEGTPLMIEVLNPTNEAVVSESVSVSGDGKFNYSFTLAEKEFVLGSYTVKASYFGVLAESVFLVEGKDTGTPGENEGGADVRVAAKQVRDLLLIRIKNAEDSPSSVYGITIETSESVIEAFKGPRNWSNTDVTSNQAASSVEEEPLNPGDKIVFKLKVSSDNFVISWIAYDSSHNVVDQGEAEPIRR